MKTQFRTVIVLNDKLQWVDIETEDLKKGDIFRMSNPDKTPVWGEGHFEGIRTFIATEDAEIKKGGVASVKSGGVTNIYRDISAYADMNGVVHAYNGREIGPKR